ncbi:MAG TPA: ergothioneine biosynthesis protein EgtB [Pyrinomonadaceae bacterium]|jgi:ergothioneine biosynthesis protein EgtB
MQATHQQKRNPGELLQFYEAVRKYTETLCEPLETEDYIPQPSIDVSPPKWNIAHTTWFFEEMILKKFAENYQIYDENFGFLFNSYYNSIGNRTRRDNRGDLSRPTVKAVFAYRRYVDERMRALLSGDLTEEIKDLIILGLNHEQQHQELFLTDLKYTLSKNPLYPVYRENFALVEKTIENKVGKSESESGDFIEINEGIYEIGFAGSGFHFDNELGRHKVFLHDFSIGVNLVTNAEYAEFVESGGYENFRFWHAEGWDWINQNEINSPLYWEKRDGELMNYTFSGLRKLKLDAPVCHISFYEAAAFAEWKGARLPTEFEWEIASDKFDWGLRWEWTNSAYLPFPNFTKPPGAVGEYNGKFMVNQMVLRGASVATPPDHSRKTYRNFFHPHLRWQFNGIRLAK